MFYSYPNGLFWFGFHYINRYRSRDLHNALMFCFLFCFLEISLTAQLLKQGYRYHKLRKTFSKFYRRHYDLVSKFNVELKSRLKQGLSELEFYGYLVYKFRKIVGRNNFSDQFRKLIIRYKRTGYNMNVM